MRTTFRIAQRVSHCAIGLITLSVVALGSGDGALAESGSQSIYVRNSGSVPLEAIRVSPDYSTRWGGDRLGAVIEPGDGVTVDLDEFANDCFFDIQVGDSNGGSREFWGVDVCTETHLEVR